MTPLSRGQKRGDQKFDTWINDSETHAKTTKADALREAVSKPAVSIVIPVFNEVKNVKPLLGLHWREILRKRRIIQKFRKTPIRELLKGGRIPLRKEFTKSPLERLGRNFLACLAAAYCKKIEKFISLFVLNTPVTVRVPAQRRIRNKGSELYEGAGL